MELHKLKDKKYIVMHKGFILDNVYIGKHGFLTDGVVIFLSMDAAVKHYERLWDQYNLS